MWDCAEGCPAAELDRQSGVLTSGANPARRGSDKFRDAYGDFAGQAECVVHRGADSGGASRFFPVFKYQAKATSAERPKLPDGTKWPTVKPLPLICWLVTLVRLQGGTVLDMFAGSGTTAEACVIEGFPCILIEKDPVAAELIKTRLSKPIQPTLFGLEDASLPPQTTQSLPAFIGPGSQGRLTQGEAESNRKVNQLSIKTKVFAAAAALTLVAAPVTWAATTAANAATPSCGSSCIDVFSKNFGTFHNPQFVMDVFRQSAAVGQPVILFRQSNSDPAEDFTVTDEGQVSDFHAAGLVSSQLNLHYGCNFNDNTNTCGNSFPDDYAFEVEYAPYGALSGLCVGVGLTAGSGTPVNLQPCGNTSKTVWVVDTLDSCLSNPLYRMELPVINGSTTNFSHPAVLDYPAAGFPTDVPRPQLRTELLNGFSQTGNAKCGGSGSVTGVDSNQLWAAKAGVLP